MSHDLNNQEMAKDEVSSEKRKRRILSAQKKYQIFLEAQHGDKRVGEILRREGLYSADLARIREQVQEGALERLSARPGPRHSSVPRDEYERLQRELAEKEKALAELSVELTILRILKD